jgi:AcrR family transcriptional regulator
MDTRLDRNRRKAATRTALLEAGRRFVEERGAHATQVGDIARAAGVAHGTFYVHFASKDALLDELWAEFDSSLESKLEPLLATALSRPREAVLTEVATICLDHWAAHRGLLRALAERAAARSDLHLLRDGVSPSLAARVTKLLTDLGAGGPEMSLVAQGLLGMWMRIGLLYVFADSERPSRDQAVRALVSSTIGVLDPLIPKAS